MPLILIFLLTLGFISCKPPRSGEKPQTNSDTVEGAQDKKAYLFRKIRPDSMDPTSSASQFMLAINNLSQDSFCKAHLVGDLAFMQGSSYANLKVCVEGTSECESYPKAKSLDKALLPTEFVGKMIRVHAQPCGLGVCRTNSDGSEFFVLSKPYMVVPFACQEDHLEYLRSLHSQLDEAENLLDQGIAASVSLSCKISTGDGLNEDQRILNLAHNICHLKEPYLRSYLEHEIITDSISTEGKFSSQDTESFSLGLTEEPLDESNSFRGEILLSAGIVSFLGGSSLTIIWTAEDFRSYMLAKAQVSEQKAKMNHMAEQIAHLRTVDNGSFSRPLEDYLRPYEKEGLLKAAAEVNKSIDKMEAKATPPASSSAEEEAPRAASLDDSINTLRSQTSELKKQADQAGRIREGFDEMKKMMSNAKSGQDLSELDSKLKTVKAQLKPSALTLPPNSSGMMRGAFLEQELSKLLSQTEYEDDLKRLKGVIQIEKQLKTSRTTFLDNLNPKGSKKNVKKLSSDKLKVAGNLEGLLAARGGPPFLRPPPQTAQKPQETVPPNGGFKSLSEEEFRTLAFDGSGDLSEAFVKEGGFSKQSFGAFNREQFEALSTEQKEKLLKSYNNFYAKRQKLEKSIQEFPEASKDKLSQGLLMERELLMFKQRENSLKTYTIYKAMSDDEFLSSAKNLSVEELQRDYEAKKAEASSKIYQLELESKSTPDSAKRLSIDALMIDYLQVKAKLEYVTLVTQHSKLIAAGAQADLIKEAETTIAAYQNHRFLKDTFHTKNRSGETIEVSNKQLGPVIIAKLFDKRQSGPLSRNIRDAEVKRTKIEGELSELLIELKALEASKLRLEKNKRIELEALRTATAAGVAGESAKQTGSFSEALDDFSKRPIYEVPSELRGRSVVLLDDLNTRIDAIESSSQGGSSFDDGAKKTKSSSLFVKRVAGPALLAIGSIFIGLSVGEFNLTSETPKSPYLESLGNIEQKLLNDLKTVSELKEKINKMPVIMRALNH